MGAFRMRCVARGEILRGGRAVAGPNGGPRLAIHFSPRFCHQHLSDETASLLYGSV